MIFDAMGDPIEESTGPSGLGDREINSLEGV
jgi:hypothetical protein